MNWRSRLVFSTHCDSELSKAISPSETEMFSESGLFLINPDNEVYCANVSSNPWGRPFLPSFVQLMDFLKQSGYPARGEDLEF